MCKGIIIIIIIFLPAKNAVFNNLIPLPMEFKYFVPWQLSEIYEKAQNTINLHLHKSNRKLSMNQPTYLPIQLSITRMHLCDHGEGF